MCVQSCICRTENVCAQNYNNLLYLKLCVLLVFIEYQ